MAPLPTLVCKECGYVNESERVYCHGCGAKLDREILAAQKPQPIAPEQKQREVRKLMKPRGNTFLGNFGSRLLRTLALAALVAALIDAALPPRQGLPDLQKESAAGSVPVDVYLEKLTAAPTAQRLGFREADVNAYLKRERFKTIPAWFTSALPLQRLLVHFEEGAATLSVQASVAGYPLYAGFSGRPAADPQHGLTATCTGGNIGRLQIPAPAACPAAAALLPLLTDSLRHERELLARIGSVEVKKEMIILGSRGPAAAPSTAVPGSPQGRPTAL